MNGPKALFEARTFYPFGIKLLLHFSTFIVNCELLD
jgi:hypothetical protein